MFKASGNMLLHHLYRDRPRSTNFSTKKQVGFFPKNNLWVGSGFGDIVYQVRSSVWKKNDVYLIIIQQAHVATQLPRFPYLILNNNS